MGADEDAIESDVANVNEECVAMGQTVSAKGALGEEEHVVPENDPLLYNVWEDDGTMFRLFDTGKFATDGSSPTDDDVEAHVEQVARDIDIDFDCADQASDSAPQSTVTDTSLIRVMDDMLAGMS